MGLATSATILMSVLSTSRRIDISDISILGTGWLGLPLAKHLVAKGHSIKASARKRKRFSMLSSFKIQPYEVVLDTNVVYCQEFLDSKILIINIPSKNIVGFKDLVIAIEQSSIKKVLFVSSTSVYPELNRTIFEGDGLEDEDHLLRQTEKLFLNSTIFDTTIVRFGGLIGYERHPGFFFEKGKKINNPRSKVNLIHRDDCINIITKIIDLSIWGEVFNCCADTHPTKLDFYSQAARQVDNRVEVAADKNSLNYKIISNYKIKQMIDYEFKYSDLMAMTF